MEVAAGLIKLNPDSKSKVDEWRDTMKSRMDEAPQVQLEEVNRQSRIKKDSE